MSSKTNRPIAIAFPIVLLVAATLVMGAGWGIRGSFGHSRGAMVPGALLGLVLVACAGRPDWWQRGALVGLFSGIGWAFGGASSYGLLVGYTMKADLGICIHGYFGLSLVGALYSGLGCGLIGIALTKSNRFLELALWSTAIVYASWLALDWSGAVGWSLQQFAKSVEKTDETKWLFDTQWLCALVSLPLCAVTLWIHGSGRTRLKAMHAQQGTLSQDSPASLMLLMSLGWWVSMAVLIGAIGIRLNPGRNDAWAGVLGILLGMITYLIWTKNRAAVMLTAYGLLSGAIGFPLGMFLQALGRLKVGPMASVPFLAELDHWTLMEQTFGYCMGLGAALGVWRLVRNNLTAALEDRLGMWSKAFSVWILVGLVPVVNLPTNFASWIELELLKPTTTNISTYGVLTWIVGALLAMLGLMIVQQERGRIDLLPASGRGRIQFLALAMMAIDLLLYLLIPRLRLPTFLMFVSAFLVGSLCVIHTRELKLSEPLPEERACQSRDWNLGWPFVILSLLLPPFLVGLGYWTTSLPR